MPPRQNTRFVELEAFVRQNASMLAQRHLARPLVDELSSSESLLLNTLRTKPPEQELFYHFVKRLVEKDGQLSAEEKATMQRIWAIVRDAAQTADSVPGSSSARPADYAAEVQTTTKQLLPDTPLGAAASQCQDIDIPMWMRPDWGDFSDDQKKLREVVEWCHAHAGVGLGSGSLKQVWSRLRRRCDGRTGPRPRDRQLPEGIRPLIGYIEQLQHEYPKYLEKIHKRKWKEHNGADEWFLNGEWDVANYTARDIESVRTSKPVLSGGRELLRVTGQQSASRPTVAAVSDQPIDEDLET